jgi:hypothetical protein
MLTAIVTALPIRDWRIEIADFRFFVLSSNHQSEISNMNLPLLTLSTIASKPQARYAAKELPFL